MWLSRMCEVIKLKKDERTIFYVYKVADKQNYRSLFKKKTLLKHYITTLTPRLSAARIYTVW